LVDRIEAVAVPDIFCNQPKEYPMPNFVELDQTVTFAQQLDAAEGGPIILVNVLTVASSDVDQLLAAWASDAALLRQQPGFISTQLHRGIAGSGTFLNYAVWETVAQYRAARTNTKLRAQALPYPKSLTAKPHLFRTIAVPGICVA
jgi:heme-degrading monooxygenase HmoA